MKKLFKNISKLFVMTLAVALVSCGGDDEVVAPEVPTLTVTPTNAAGSSYSVGDKVEISFSFTAPGEISSFNYSGILNEGLADEATLTKVFVNPTDLNLSSNTEGNFIVNFDVQSEFEGKTVSFTFEVVDKNDQAATGSYNYTVSVAIDTYTAKLFGAQGNTNPGFYNALDGSLHSYAEARDASTVTESTVDFAYYWGATNKSTLASIDDTDLNTVYNSVNLPIEGIFGTKNSTMFKALTTSAADFDAITSNNQLEAVAFFEVGGSSSSTTLVNDAVVAFKLDAARGGKIGLLKVVSVDDTNGTGTITIDVKIAK
jgi:hypothetical protein